MRCIFVSLQSKVHCLPFLIVSIKQIVVVFTNDKNIKLKREEVEEATWEGEEVEGRKRRICLSGYGCLHCCSVSHNEPVAGDEQSSSLLFTPRGKAFFQLFKANLFIQTVFLI